MPRRSVLLPVLAAGLLLSVPLKAWTIAAAHTGSEPAPEASLARALDAMGFRTSPEDRLLGRPAILGRAGACTVWMGLVSGEGWHRDIVVSSVPPGADVAFFFRGRAYADQPAWATWFDEKLSVLARSFAMPLQASPVVAAHLGRDCHLDLGVLAGRLRSL